MKKTLTIREVAAQLGLTEKALRQRIARREFPSRRWGRRLLILATDVDAFLNGLPGTSAEEAAARKEGRF